MFNKPYIVYILTNLQKTVLYTGVRNSLKDRIIEHFGQRANPKTFAGKYRTHYLLYYESFDHITDAIRREKENHRMEQKKKDAFNQ
ncbi:MAG: GIY-YIG nuclease family protein [Flavisolibacter sp.]